MSYRILKSYEFSHEAHLDLAKLQDEGIRAFLKNDTMVSIAPHYSNAVGGVLLVVESAQWDFANRLLLGNQDTEQMLQELYPDSKPEENRQCTRCGSRDVFQGRSVLSGIMFLILFVLPVSLRKNRFHCATCDHSWREKA